MGQLKAFQLVAGGHVGPDYSQDPYETDVPTANGLKTQVEFPVRNYKPRAAGAPRVPGETNIVYSPDDLSAKFNHQNSTKFIALGDAPREVQERFDAAVQTGLLLPRQGGRQSVGSRRPIGNFGNRTSWTSEVGPFKGTVNPDPKGLTDEGRKRAEDEKAAREQQNQGGDPRDVSPPQDDDEDLNSMTVADLRELAKAEGIEVPSRATKDEVVHEIEKGRKAKAR